MTSAFMPPRITPTVGQITVHALAVSATLRATNRDTPGSVANRALRKSRQLPSKYIHSTNTDVFVPPLLDDGADDGAVMHDEPRHAVS